MNKTTALLSSLFLSSAASAQLIQSPEIEPLIGHMLSPQGVHLQVKSNGCTMKEDFYVSRSTHGRTHSLSFYRLKADLCRAHLPYGKVFTFTYAELGILQSDMIVISNPDVEVTVL